MAPPRPDVSKSRPKNAQISTKGPIYRIAGVEIDPAQASVRRGSEQIALRPKTYWFLLYLIEHHNRVVSKEELIDKIWGGASVSDGVLVASIGEIRKAFGEDPKDPQIFKTFPKMGYGLMAEVETVGASLPLAPVFPWRSATLAALLLILAVAGVVVWRSNRQSRALLYHEVAWWKLDAAVSGKTADAAGHGLTGTISGTPRFVPGRLGNGLWFDGLHTAVSGRSDGLPSGNAARTITAWFQAALPHVDVGPIFDYGQAERFTLYVRTDGRLLVGGGSGTLPTAGIWADGNWHFVAASYSGAPDDSAAILVDGTLDAETRFSRALATSPRGTWRIGNFVSPGGFFRGAMDDVRVYARALRPAMLAGIYRCSAGIRDLDDYYFLPVFSGNTVLEPRGEQDLSTPVWHNGLDVGGIQLAHSQGDCELPAIEGADAGQDLRIGVDLMVPVSADGKPTLAGPYFRSRLAAGGDGIIGGTSAGYWVQLVSSGMVKIKRLNPWAMVAFSDAIPGFDAARFHRLEMEAKGEELQVRLDGMALSFDQGGARITRVQIPPTWLGPPVAGFNQGAAGVAFATLDEDRGRAGGQRARNLEVRRLTPITSR